MKANTRVSANFTVAEILRTSNSGFASKQRQHFADERIINACRLAHEILEPLRAVFKKPILPTSWLRCPELNSAIGGSAGSQHVTGLAVDVMIPGVDLWTAFEALALAPIGQRILYLSEQDEPLWLHLSLPDSAWKWDGKQKGWVCGGGFRHRDLLCHPHSARKSYVPYTGTVKERCAAGK